MKCRIYFADEQVREAYMALKASRESGIVGWPGCCRNPTHAKDVMA